MNKAALINACDFLHLLSQGTVIVLRDRLMAWARAHRDEFQHDPDYTGFYRTKGVRQQQAPQPIPNGEDEEQEPSDDSEDEEEEIQPPPPPPSSDRSSSHSSGTRSRRSSSHPSEHDERSVSPERSHSQDRKGFFNGRPIRRIGTKVTDATDFLIPPKVRKIFEHGWREHVPLSMLTDDACTFVQQISLATSRKDLYTDPSSPTLLSQEVSLNFDQWTQAWERLIKLIKEYVPREYPLWWRHYEFIRTKDTCSSAFPTWLEYDIIMPDYATITKIANRPTPPTTTTTDLAPILVIGFGTNFPKTPTETTPMAVGPSIGVCSAAQATTTPEPAPPQRLPTKNPSSYLPNKILNSPELTLTDVPTVFHGTVKTLSAPMHAVPVNTHVHSAATRSITLNAAPCPSPSLLPIITCLIADAWELALNNAGKLDEFKDVPNGIRNGFDLGTSSAIPSSTYIPPNHSSATSHPDAVLSNIHNELANRRYTGPFSPDRLENLIGPFRTSPLGVVPKNGSNQFRLVQNFSYPYDDPLTPSVNGTIDTSNLFCDWGTFQRAADIVRNAPPNTLAATLDVDAAFRRCPILPSQQPNFVVSWMGSCYIDHCAPFGARSSGFIFGRLADAFTAILKFNKIDPVINWVDDFAIFNYPSPTSTPSCPIYTYSLDDIYALANSLGWPWKLSKTTPFLASFKYLGFLWNLALRTVEIPEEKKSKYLEKLSTWMSEQKFTRREAESLLGTLVHCSLAIPDGRSHLPSLSRFATSFNGAKSPHIRKSPNPSVATDIKWWHSILSSPFAGSSLTNPPPPSSIPFWVDASTSWGIGVIFNNSWDAWKLRDGWKSNGRTIGWAEFIAIELGILMAVAQGFNNIHFIIHSDNQGVIYAIQNGRSRSHSQNTTLQRICCLLVTHSIHITCKYVTSSTNLADAPSRGTPLSNIPRSSTHIDIPDDISPYLTRA
ncbi:hypothetical protein CVT24_005588 [Panaeolus cyanescens]|uniref:Reverse transcriptase domain-containing protein n=1 Tax=Panaeolus cyanescens TaxID=181874 RepID=A0A409WY47_9AGAR|nr:hypothetical protein CVT24_005588 [Panaeolus cyanescens]